MDKELSSTQRGSGSFSLHDSSNDAMFIKEEW